MRQEIHTIRLSLPYRMGSVNCYLIQTATGFVLIDTGPTQRRTQLQDELESTDCKPGDLDLIFLTHGDFDHSGNCAYLRSEFGAKIAMHRDDAGMTEHRDMFWNRQKGNRLTRMVAPILFGFGKSQRFVPDLYLEDGDDLSEYGFHATVLSIPGHSKGSIGFVTDAGDLFSGDLLENGDKPALNAIMDDAVAANASVETLKRRRIGTVYPGHGAPFPMEEFMKDLQPES